MNSASTSTASIPVSHALRKLGSAAAAVAMTASLMRVPPMCSGSVATIVRRPVVVVAHRLWLIAWPARAGWEEPASGVSGRE